MLDDRDQFPWMEQEELAAFNQDTRDSIRGKNNYSAVHIEQGGYWPSQPIHDVTSDMLMWEDAYDPS